MADRAALEGFLAGASVDASVFALRPDYRALLLAVDGLTPVAGIPGRTTPGARPCCSGRRTPWSCWSRWGWGCCTR